MDTWVPISSAFRSATNSTTRRPCGLAGFIRRTATSIAALHHGVWLADALRRPKFINFEDKGGVLPAHTTGVWVDRRPTARATVSSCTTSTSAMANRFRVWNRRHANRREPAWRGHGRNAAVLSVHRRKPSMACWWVVNGFTDKVNDDNAANPALIRLNMGGAHYAVLRYRHWGTHHRGLFVSLTRA